MINVQNNLYEDIRDLESEISFVQNSMEKSHDKSMKLRDLHAALERIRTVQENTANKVLKIPIGTGIVGQVSSSVKSINTQNIQESDLLDCEKVLGGYRKTKNILCQCIFDTQGDIIGVIEAINKKDTVFSKVC